MHCYAKFTDRKGPCRVKSVEMYPFSHINDSSATGECLHFRQEDLYRAVDLELDVGESPNLV